MLKYQTEQDKFHNDRARQIPNDPPAQLFPCRISPDGCLGIRSVTYVAALNIGQLTLAAKGLARVMTRGTYCP